MREHGDGVTEEQTDEREELAEERTDWAFERTLLANDRTFSAWIRTGLTTMAAGFAVTQLLTEVQPTWLIPSLGVLFIVVGGGMIAMGYWSHRATLRRLSEEEGRKRVGWIVGAIAAALILGAGASLWLIT